MANGVVTKGAAKTMQKPKPDAKRDGIWTRAKRFLKESYIEVRYKAAWPTFNELKKFTTVVIAAVLVAAIYLGVLDWALSNITARLGFGIQK